MSKIPFPLLYPLSDFFAFLVGPVFGYRKKVIRKNLVRSFPGLPEQEIRKVTKAFYRNFSDVFLETFKLLSISGQELEKRVKIKNLEMLNDRLAQGQSLLALTAHYCNWEWLLAACSLRLIYPPDAIYLRVKNPFFEKLMLKIRSRFGAYMIEKKYILSEANKRRGKVRVIAMVADQAPAWDRSVKWIRFLNQDTPFINGPERMAKILNLPVIYCKMNRTGRGYYDLEFSEILPEAGGPGKDEITERFGSILEETIKNYPPNWLWSHNRWKRVRPNEENPVTA